MVDLNMKVVEPRKLTTESRFKFRCHPGISCFTECCGKTTIILTPYDILRLKNRLNMKAADFLAKYTRMEAHDKSGLPMVIMDMPRFEHHCPFVGRSPAARSIKTARPPAATIPSARAASSPRRAWTSSISTSGSRTAAATKSRTSGPWLPGGKTRGWTSTTR